MKKILLSFLLGVLACAVHAQDYPNLYAVGSAFNCGWSADDAYPMVKEENGIFTWSGPMKRGDFKFLLKTTPTDIWINCLNAKVANEKIIIGNTHDIVYVENSRITDNDFKFMMDDEGEFEVVIDTKEMTLTIKKSDLISVSDMNGIGKRIVNIHSCSGKTNGEQSAYKLLIGKDENLKNVNNKWCYNGDDPWVIFSLPAVYSINKFAFRDGRIKETGAEVKNLPGYKVYVSTTGTADGDWTEVINETNVGDQNEKSKKITPVEARYIKFVPVKDPDDSYIRIYGVDIHGTFVRTLRDDVISTGKTIVDYHGAWSNRETPANIIDGNRENAAGEDANNPWAFARTTPGWVIIDLEDTYTVSKLVLVDSEEWLTGYKVYVSSFVGKDSDWKLIADNTFNKTQVAKEITLTQASGVSGRYIKLEIPVEYQEGLTRIREFEVYGALAPKPGIITNHADLKKAYELAVWTTELNKTQDGILKAGARYDGKWTRDLSINVWNGYPFLEPEIAKNSLLSLLENNEQQYIGAEYWDKIIWVKGAYMYYLMTGDFNFLDQALISGMNTMKQLEEMTHDGYPVFDSQYGLFTGPSVFNDGIAGYEVPVFSGNAPGGAVVSHPAHKQIKCLSTNCIYYEAYRLLAQIAAILNDNILVPGFETKAAALKTNIRKHLFNAETGKLNYLIDQLGNAHPHQEGLGISFAVMFDIVTAEEARKIINEAYITQFGLPSVSPHFVRFNDDKPGRHNVMIWPFVNAYFADACIKTKNYDKYKFELFNLIDLGLNKGGNNFWEIYDPKNGLPDGGWQTGGHWGGLEHQTWSATGFLNMVWYGLAGIQLQKDKILFSPYLPGEIGSLELTNLKYGDMLLNIKLEGEGTKIKEFKIDGVTQNDPEISQLRTGEHTVSIVLEKDNGTNTTEKNAGKVFTSFADNGGIQVMMNNNNMAETAELFDISGKSIDSKEKQTDTFSLGKNLNKGIYILKLKCNNIDYTQKIIL